MTWKSRLTASIVSAVISANLAMSGVFALPVDERGSLSSSPDSELFLNTERHAYDPIADMEAEQAYREATKYTANKIIFSVLDRRLDGASVQYLHDQSVDFVSDLTDITYIMECRAENVETQQGYSAYEVFYEAQTAEADVWRVVDEIRSEESVLSAEPDFIWEKADYAEATNEELAHETHFSALHVSDVWDDLAQNNVVAPGYGTVVAVIDTGVDYNHFDLKNSMWKNTGEIPDNGIDDDENGYIDDVYGIDLIENDGDPMDDHGHGTHVAGIIAMEPGNGGGVGLAYGAKIMAIKAGQANGLFASTDIAKAIKYAADNGADVINMSFGGAGKSALVEAALRDAFSTSVLVAAAGNDGQPTEDACPYGYPQAYDCYPAAYTYVLGVMASDNSGNIAGFSNWDFSIGANGEYELAAPGVGIYSTLPGDRYTSWNGTSMAAPNVSAAAAIIRSQYTNKSKYTSRYIMGQLVSATQSTANKYDDFENILNTYPALNIGDSLTCQPKPAINLNEFYLFDDPAISDTNNGDGIAQPGEIIDIGVSAFNRWGIADNVTVTVDATSAGGVANPYVEFITNTAVIGEIGTFVTGNNGFTYTDGALTGVSKPLRIKIKEGSPNDAMVQLNFTATATNGMDETDTNTYSFTGSHTVTIQNGYPLSGVIHEDMTLTADKYWIIQNNVLIPEGITVTVEPGTQIQFWSADPANPYADNADVYIQVEGRFIAEGTEEQPIKMFPGKGYEFCGVKITGNDSRYYLDPCNNIVDEDYDTSYISLAYSDIINFGFEKDFEFNRTSTSVTLLDHCRLEYTNMKYRNYCGIFARTISNTVLQHISSLNQSRPRISAFVYSNCLFDNIDSDISSHFSGSGYKQWDQELSKSVIMNVKCKNIYQYEDVEYNGGNNHYSPLVVHNAFLTKSTIFNTVQGHNTYDISGNYWGTTNPDLVKIQCWDADWNVSLNDLIQEPFLTLEDDMSSIYPFMTEAYLTDTDGNRIDSVNGSQTVTMHVKFNRDMAQDVQPMVSYGGSEPYTDYILSGSWLNAREWTSTFTIDPYIDMGRMYIRSKGAVAADDRWLVTGEDCARFFFEVTSASAQSMSLQGSGVSGACELTWLQDDYDTFAGYNLYRGTSYDSSIELSKQGFQRINSSVIIDESLTDTNVEQGKDYYYYFTVLDTALHESKPSNVIKCTPLDEMGPEITHTPVLIAALGDSVTIKADVQDNVNVDAVTLFYRQAGETDWDTAVMRNITGNTYSAVISAYEITGSAIEYYIAASDGTNTSAYASEDEPLTIQIDADHRYDEGTVTVQPTCTEDGKIVYHCQDCGHEITEDIPKLGHDYQTDWTVDTEATCTATGEKSHHCTRCDAKSDITEIPMAEHVWDAGKITKSNSCTEDGLKHFKCIDCGAEKDMVISATGHNYQETVHPATCTDRGFTEHLCQNCGESYKSDFTEVTEHAFEEVILSEATCTTDGVKQLCCTQCNHKISEVIPAYGHHFEDTIVEPTTDSLGYTLHTCETCGYSYIDSYTEYISDEPSVRTPGDVNGDGLVDLVDVILIRRYLAGGWNVTINTSNADVDGDGDVTLQDVILIRRYLAGGWGVQLK